MNESTRTGQGPMNEFMQTPITDTTDNVESTTQITKLKSVV